jgi:hypothetical protein
MGLPLPVLCAGCTGWQSAMNPMGTEAHELRNLIWLFTVVAAVVWVLVMLVLAGPSPACERTDLAERWQRAAYHGRGEQCGGRHCSRNRSADLRELSGNPTAVCQR